MCVCVHDSEPERQYRGFLTRGWSESKQQAASTRVHTTTLGAVSNSHLVALCSTQHAPNTHKVPPIMASDNMVKDLADVPQKFVQDGSKVSDCQVVDEVEACQTEPSRALTSFEQRLTCTLYPVVAWNHSSWQHVPNPQSKVRLWLGRSANIRND